MPVLLPWPSTDTIHRVLAHLAAGECVALPTESTYELVASAIDPRGLEHLQAQARNEQQPALAISERAQAFDWLPLLRGAGARLLRKQGPGPYVLRAMAGYQTGLTARLPDLARALVVREDRLALRWPAHAVWGELQPSAHPLITLALPGAVDAAKTQSIVGGRVACIVDGGPTELAQLPTIVDFDGRRCHVARAGGLSAESLDERTRCRILFICTGNTCRSPMAESLCAKLLADRLGCTPAELPGRGFCVQSAGLAAMRGAEASSEAAVVVKDLGADLAPHRSCMASIDMLLWADFVFAMTSGHWYTLRTVRAPGLPEPRMLSPTFEDIADPIGGTMADYRTCANQIMECLQQRLPELLES
jgi:L-threonylcarbamoyladenylate synthase